MQLSDRIIVLLEGAVMGELRRDEFDVNTIGLLMSGVTEATASGSTASESTASGNTAP